VKVAMDIRLKAVVLYSEGFKTAGELSRLYNVSERTLRRWATRYAVAGVCGLEPKSTKPKSSANQTTRALIHRVLALKKKYPAWGARRLKFQFNLPMHWTTVHDILKANGLLIKIKAKPQPCKRFQRKHVDSMWQGDTFQFRIHDVGKVYVTGFTDDCSRFRVQSKAYLDKSAKSAVNCLEWALRKKRKPRQIYLDNGKQFVAKVFKNKAKEYGIKLIFGKPYHPRGRGKIEKYHGKLYRELIAIKQFRSLAHFRRELWRFDRQYNNWRKQEPLGWQTPASVYLNKKYFNKNQLCIQKRTNVRLTKRTNV